MKQKICKQRLQKPVLNRPRHLRVHLAVVLVVLVTTAVEVLARISRKKKNNSMSEHCTLTVLPVS
jgi:hypothetical protein